MFERALQFGPVGASGLFPGDSSSVEDLIVVGDTNDDVFTDVQLLQASGDLRPLRA